MGSLFKQAYKAADGTTKHTAHWYGEFWRNGRRHRVSLRGLSYRDARRRLTELEAGAPSESPEAPASQGSLKGLLRGYLESLSVAGRSGSYVSQVGRRITRLLELSGATTPEALRTLGLETLGRLGVAPRTIREYSVSLGGFRKHLVRLGLMEDPGPSVSVRVPPMVPRPAVSRTDAQRVLRSFSEHETPRVCDAVTVLVTTGLRRESLILGSHLGGESGESRSGVGSRWSRWLFGVSVRRFTGLRTSGS